MQIRIKLIPKHASPVVLELADGSTVDTALTQLGVSEKHSKVVTIARMDDDGDSYSIEATLNTPLVVGDLLTVTSNSQNG
jgi:hypothetical protein